MLLLPPHPALPDVDALLRRHDGPPPAEELLSRVAGQPASLLRLRSITREVDRLALGVGRLVAAYREDLARCRAARDEDPAIEELSHRLAHYRKVGVGVSEEIDRLFAGRR